MPYYIIASYGRRRNVRLEKFWFGSREEAKAYAKTNLDPDEEVGCYTIYEADCYSIYDAE